MFAWYLLVTPLLCRRWQRTFSLHLRILCATMGWWRMRFALVLLGVNGTGFLAFVQAWSSSSRTAPFRHPSFTGTAPLGQQHPPLTTTRIAAESRRDRRADPPPDITIDDVNNSGEAIIRRRPENSQKTTNRSDGPARGSVGWKRENDAVKQSKKPSRRSESNTVDFGTSWMQRNDQFTNTENVNDDEAVNEPSMSNQFRAPPNRRPMDDRNAGRGEAGNTSTNNKSFRQDFRGTRVFVQGLPPHCTWQTLKDHFKIAGNVVFASVSTDQATGQSKGHGIVQYETTDEANNAIRMMRSFPLEANVLYVREDVQDTVAEQPWSSQSAKAKGPTPPSKWKCANAEDSILEESTVKIIQQLLKARDQARRRRNYEASDSMREELRQTHNVQLDDRLSLWWIGTAAPVMIQDINGDGRWGDRTTEWRQIPTTLESDACVDPALVEGLLKQRDIARREKDFSTADMLLEQARNAPDGDLYLRIHDESRTWRIWTDEAPKRPVRHDTNNEDTESASPSSQCISICQEHAPEKVDEVTLLLEKFPGREYNILKKLKQRYLLN